MSKIIKLELDGNNRFKGISDIPEGVVIVIQSPSGERIHTTPKPLTCGSCGRSLNESETCFHEFAKGKILCRPCYDSMGERSTTCPRCDKAMRVCECGFSSPRTDPSMPYVNPFEDEEDTYIEPLKSWEQDRKSLRDKINQILVRINP